MAEELERVFIIPLKNKNFKSSKAAPTAVKRVKKYLTKHMKVKEKDIWIDDSLNNAIWSNGKYKMSSKIRVKAVKFDDGIVEAYLPELEFKRSRRELLREEREKKAPILRREEVEGEEEPSGAEDYEIAPAADGDVKIKKKKQKEEKPKKEKSEEKKEKKTEKKEPKKKSTKKSKEDKKKKSKQKKDKKEKSSKKSKKSSSSKGKTKSKSSSKKKSK